MQYTLFLPGFGHLRDLVSSLGFEVCGLFHSGEQFLKKTDSKFDAALVDIFLSGELSGLEIALLSGKQGIHPAAKQQQSGSERTRYPGFAGLQGLYLDRRHLNCACKVSADLF